MVEEHRSGCPINLSVEVLGDKWSLVILRDPSHKQKVLYSLTEPTIQLVPVMAHLGAWGRRHLPVTRELAVRAEVLERGGPELWERFMEELREEHLGIPRPTDSESVLARLRAAYEGELAQD